MGHGQSGRLSEASLTCVELQTFEKRQEPFFCCRCSPHCFSQSRWRSQVRSSSTSASKTTKTPQKKKTKMKICRI